MQRALFICSKNRLRSPTAEQIFAGRPNVEVDSAGLAADANIRVSSDHIAWATIIFVMEPKHRTALRRQFAEQLRGKRVVCLHIADRYRYMQPELIARLLQQVEPHLSDLP